tara:strand:- start:35499 stop:35804 length:306 start_codon:yes stop_codon:yes gene_type:complete
MAIHISRFGQYGKGLKRHADIDGYIPEPSDGPWDGRWDHGVERTHNDDGSLTGYGEWFAREKWPDILFAATEALDEIDETLWWASIVPTESDARTRSRWSR